MSTIAGDQGQTGLQRRNAVVLQADVVGYSRLLADDPAATVATLRAYQDVVAEAVDAVGGSVVNFVGDSFLSVFDDAPAAMRAAIAISHAVRQRNAGLPQARRMWFRMGLDAGVVVIAEDGRHFGDPLNIAARVQSIAEVGGINVTEAVYIALDEPALRLHPLGPRRLKHIPELVRVYRLVSQSIDEERAVGRVFDPRGPSIAVLPFGGSGDDATQVADALRADVVSGLAKIPGVRIVDVGVVADTGTPIDPADHHAHYTLTGRVLPAGERVRAYVQLTDTDTMNRVWGDRWDGTTDDLFALQDAVTAGTVRALELELVVGEPARIYRSVLDGAALDAVYRGLYQLLAGPRSGWRSAVELFSSVAASHPDEVVGVALGAFSLWWGVMQGLSDTPDADLERAGTLATRGIALDDQTGLSQMVAAALRLHAGGDPGVALQDARRAVALRPTCDVSFAVEASVHRYLGDWRAAVEACERAMELSPLPRPWFSTVMASAYYVGEQYQDAADTAERVVELQPDALEAWLVLAASQQALGLSRRARATVDAIVARFHTVRRDELWRHHPYRDPDIVARWTDHLVQAGLP